MPVAPVEAMASQRIVIGSSEPGVKEVLKNFEKCMFKSKSSDAIVDKIQMIRELSLEEKNKLAQLQRKEVENVFNMKDCVRKHEIFYLEKVLK